MGRNLDAATHKAEQVLHELGQTSIPVDVMSIARDRKIKVLAKEAGIGVSGMLIRVGDNFLIAYATHINNDGFQRFSIAHELGHYFLDGHIDHVIGENGIHESRAGHVSRDEYEIEADHFAAALLMPRRAFVTAACEVGDGLAGIEMLASRCRTSLTATAIRYAECIADEFFAVVVAKDELIESCTMSEKLKKLPNITWRKRGDRVPRRTATYRLLGNPGRVLYADREDGTSHLHDWFDLGPNLQLYEEAVGLGRSGRVLTVLTLHGGMDEEEEEERNLVESWTPTLHRSRRR